MQAIILKLRKTNLFNNVSIGDELQLQKSIENTILNKSKVVTVTVDSSQSIHIIFETTSYNGGKTFKVLSAYHNGISDRTTYNGFHRGVYDIETLDSATDEVLRRVEGKHKTIEIFDNVPKALQFLPIKYRKMIASDSYYGGRDDGYWIYLTNEFFNDEMQCQTIHEYTQKDVLKVLKTSRKITDEDKKQANYKF